MLIANLYGRLGNDPTERHTKSGATMATTSIVVDVTAHNAEEPASQWFNVIAFGTAADELLRAQKGQMVAALGKLTRSEYTAKTGEVREQWSLVADSVVTVKAAKPTGKVRDPGQPRPPGQGQQARPQGRQATDHGAPFDDEIPF